MIFLLERAEQGKNGISLILFIYSYRGFFLALQRTRQGENVFVIKSEFFQISKRSTAEVETLVNHSRVLKSIEWFEDQACLAMLELLA